MASQEPTNARTNPLAKNRSRERVDVADTPMLERAQKWLIHHGLEHLHGPSEIPCRNDGLIVLCLLRDGMTHIEAFVDHHLALGAKHLVFLDNGSTDGTVEFLEGRESVTVLRTRRPYRTYQVAMKQYLVERFGPGCWTLYADVDELFDYPYSDVIPLKDLLGSRNENRYTAMVAHMLDVFPEGLLSGTEAGGSLKETHRFYDVSDLILRDYSEADLDNEVSSGGISIYQGGVQKRLFGISPMLTKHSLVFMDGNLRPMDLSDHFAGGARVADITGVLLHYKLSSSLYGAVRRELEERSYPNRFGKYDRYAEALEETPELRIKDKNSRELQSVNDLAHNGFLTISWPYMVLVDGKEREASGKLSDEPRALLTALSETGRSLRDEVRRNAELRYRIRGLEAALERERMGAGDAERWRLEGQRLGRRAENLEEHAARLERRLEAVYASRTWKALTFLGRVRARLSFGKRD